MKLFPSPELDKGCMLAHVCNPKIQEVEAVEPEINAYSLLWTEFEASMGYKRSWLKNIIKYSQVLG